jgi:hypothetical protein
MMSIDAQGDVRKRTEEKQSELWVMTAVLCTGLCLSGDLGIDELGGKSLGLLPSKPGPQSVDPIQQTRVLGSPLFTLSRRLVWRRPDKVGEWVVGAHVVNSSGCHHAGRNANQVGIRPTRRGLYGLKALS